MKIETTDIALEKIKADALALGVFEDGMTGNAKHTDSMLNGKISHAVKRLKPEFGSLQAISTLGKINAENIILVGLGRKKDLDTERIRKATAAAAKAARDTRMKTIATDLNMLHKDAEKAAQAVAEGAMLGLYKFEKYKAKKTNKIESLQLIAPEKKCAGRGIKTGIILSESVNYVRDIVNTPACFATPERLAREAAGVKNVRTKVYGKADMKRMGMNSILAVSKGSTKEPKLIVMDYNSRARKCIAIVGKGITFDSGGLDLKPASAMEEMKSDKAGAAAVIGIMKTLDSLKIPMRVVGFLPVTENMPGPDAAKPGDIITAYNKKTIEIVNTDAEGRLVLADALSYAETFKPDAIIDLATLTGACIVALGYGIAGLIGNNEKLAEKIKKAASETQERVWQLPLYDDYKELVDSDIADVKNARKGLGYGPGTIEGAAFLERFVKKTPWAHIDIAGTAWSPEERWYTQRGATGFGVRLITELLLKWE